MKTAGCEARRGVWSGGLQAYGPILPASQTVSPECTAPLPLAALAAFQIASCASSAQTPTRAVEPAFPGLSFASPIELTDAGDGSGAVYVAEKAGRISAIAGDRATATKTTVLDITALVQNSGEQGLLGMAFHPNFETNGYVYVHYSGRPDGRTVLARYTRSATDPAVFDPASAQIVLEVPQPYNNHNGGKLAFGPDGFLYLSLGDGGSGGDPGNRAQNRADLHGKLLRLDVDTPASGLAYGIPPDNPFAGNTSGYREEIYAYGLRNMFRFSFDSATGVLWGADVGQGAIEEVDFITNGGNFGWRLKEGSACFNPSTGCASVPDLIDPIYEYTHADGCSITGGFVYHGVRNPDLEGQYLFSDYCTADLWALTTGAGTPTRRTLVSAGSSVIAIGKDAAGEPYFLRETTGPSAIYRFVETRPVAGEAAAPAAAPALRLAGANPFTDRARRRRHAGRSRPDARRPHGHARPHRRGPARRARRGRRAPRAHHRRRSAALQRLPCPDDRGRRRAVLAPPRPRSLIAMLTRPHPRRRFRSPRHQPRGRDRRLCDAACGPNVPCRRARRLRRRPLGPRLRRADVRHARLPQLVRAQQRHGQRHRERPVVRGARPDGPGHGDGRQHDAAGDGHADGAPPGLRGHREGTPRARRLARRRSRMRPTRASPATAPSPT